MVDMGNNNKAASQKEVVIYLNALYAYKMTFI